jgi:uncharacterized protein (TIGR02231 family)
MTFSIPRRFGFFPLFFLGVAVVGAEEASDAVRVKLAAPITAVTVFQDRAVVTRMGTLEVKPGVQELTFADLPADVLPQSIRVDGSGTAETTILDVRMQRLVSVAVVLPRENVLNERLEALRIAHRLLVDRLAVLTTQRETISRLLAASTTPPSKESDRVKLEDVRILLDFSQERLLALAADAQKTEDAAKDNLKETETINRELNNIRTAGKKDGTNGVVVRVSSKQAGDLALSLSYTVSSATWTATYDARVIDGGARVVLDYFGLVRQTTGEDWRGVALTLSTARPAMGGGAPALAPWWVDIQAPRNYPADNQRGPKAENSARLDGAPQAADMMMKGIAASAPPARMAQAVVETGVTSATFKIEAKSTILSENSPQRVPITSATLDAQAKYHTTPKRLEGAFLSSKAYNRTGFPLLAGDMNVFLEGSFVATSRLKAVAVGDSFDLALGIDDRVKVTHKQVKRFVEENTGLTRNGRRVTYDYLMTITNMRPKAATIVVTDQVPVSRNEKVVVKVQAPAANEAKPESDGLVRWTFDLKPAEKKELRVSFAIEAELETPVIGLQ